MDSGSFGGRFCIRAKKTIRRTTVYIDGFNLYHAIDDLKKPHLKWVNLWSLAESLLKDDQTLTNVKYYSAYARWMPDEYHRHIQYVKALEAKGVEATMSEFKERRVTCFNCGATWTKHEEKETDVFLSADIVDDLRSDRFDVAIVVTADTDIRPAINKVVETEGKFVLVVTPPKRFGRARSLNPSLSITPGRIAKNLFGQSITDSSGSVVAERPSHYEPPT